MEDDMIDEACLLAGIEVFEQPSSCIDMAAKTARRSGTQQPGFGLTSDLLRPRHIP